MSDDHLTPTQLVTVLERVAADVDIKVSQVMAVIEAFSRQTAQVRAEAEFAKHVKAARTPSSPDAH